MRFIDHKRLFEELTGNAISVVEFQSTYLDFCKNEGQLDCGCSIC